MIASEKNLTAKQELALLALLSEPTQEAAAAKAGVKPVTLRRWLQDDAFQEAYRDARRQLVDGAIARLQQICTKAVETLERNLTCGNKGVEVRAAMAILEQSIKGTELQALVARVEELERQQKEAEHGSDSVPGAASEPPGDTPEGEDASGEPPGNGATPGPGADHDARGDGAGLLADDVAPLSG